MVEIALSQDRVKDGMDYLVALRGLGLDPEGLVWVRVEDRPQWVMLVVTSLYDAAGPFELTKLLFKACNSGLLPASIDPFDVDTYSPDQDLIRGIREALATEPMEDMAEPALKAPIRVGAVEIPVNGILAWCPISPASSSTLMRRWNQLKCNLALVAA